MRTRNVALFKSFGVIFEGESKVGRKVIHVARLALKGNHIQAFLWL
jgi:hypothetical protein